MLTPGGKREALPLDTKLDDNYLIMTVSVDVFEHPDNPHKVRMALRSTGRKLAPEEVLRILTAAVAQLRETHGLKETA